VRFRRIVDATIMAAAPSLTPEAFPAVIVPGVRKAGLSFKRASRVVSARGCSSLETTEVSFFAGNFDWDNFFGKETSGPGLWQFAVGCGARMHLDLHAKP